MGKYMRHRRLRATLGFLKTAGMLLAAPFLLLAWFLRAVRARSRFLRQLRAAGVPEDAARHLSNRYRLLRLREMGRLAMSASNMTAKS